MEINTVIAYIACIIFLFIIGKVFAIPLTKILKLVSNSVLGAVLIYLINIVGVAFNFHIGLNFITAIFVGLLGIPRCSITCTNRSVVVAVVLGKKSVPIDLISVSLYNYKQRKELCLILKLK